MHAQLKNRSRRGSILIVAMLLAAIIGISLVSYLKLANNSLKQANRSFYANSAMNVAEIGLEQAVACYNQLDNTSVATAWSGWTLNSTAYSASSSPYTPYAVRNFTGYNMGPDATGSVKVYVHYYDGAGASTPTIVAKSTITQLNAPPISKYIEVVLTKRAKFANGLVARNDIDWSGVPKVTSWNSDPDHDSSTAPKAYPGDGNTADAVVASLKGNIALSNGIIWGYAKTGPSGKIEDGTVQGLTGGDDPARRTHDFNATFPVPGVPSTSASVNNVSSNVTGATTFGTGSSMGTTVDPKTGAYVYVFSSSAVIKPTGGNDITIVGDVIFIMNSYTGTSTDAITVGGSAGLIISNGGSLKVYTNGNIKIDGNANLNQNAQPSTFQISGTNPDSQTITISGTSDIKVVVDAPTADVTLNGNVSVQGAVIANHIDMMGTPDFHYDDSLANLTTGNPYRISKWRELTQAVTTVAGSPERDYYQTPLSY